MSHREVDVSVGTRAQMTDGLSLQLWQADNLHVLQSLQGVGVRRENQTEALPPLPCGVPHRLRSVDLCKVRHQCFSSAQNYAVPRH